jgi:hypothetical protein
MLLGDVIAKFEDEAFVNETLLSLNNLALVAQVVAAAADNNISPGEFAMQSIGRFVNAASEEEWLTLTGLMSRVGSPGQVFLQRVLSSSLPDPQKHRGR